MFFHRCLLHDLLETHVEPTLNMDSISGLIHFSRSLCGLLNNLLQRGGHMPVRSPVSLLLALLWLPLNSMAVPGAWMPEARMIANVIVEGDAGGTALLVISGGVPADFIPPACNSIYNTLDLSTSKGRGQFVVALSAYMAGRPVKLALSCIGSRPLVTHILL